MLVDCRILQADGSARNEALNCDNLMKNETGDDHSARRKANS
jgi:hypothetical protein